MYKSNESPTLVDIYFACVPELRQRHNDVTMTLTPNNVIQYNAWTDKFFAQLGYTELFFTLAKAHFDKANFTIPGNAYVEKLKFFDSQVGNGAPFDIKANGKGFSCKEIGDIAIFEGRTYNFDDFGNINFGYAAMILGIPLDDALKGAGLNQVRKGNADWNNSQGYFDHERDTQSINFGYGYLPPWPIIKPK